MNTYDQQTALSKIIKVLSPYSAEDAQTILSDAEYIIDRVHGKNTQDETLIRTVTHQSVTIGGARYFALRLAIMSGLQVKTKADPEDDNKIIVTTLDDKYICHAKMAD